MEKALSLKAPAKINLTLEILGKKRNDGFHDIASVMWKAWELYDEISVRVSEALCGISLDCDVNVCDSKDNLAYRAAEKYLEMYKAKTGKSYGVHIDIKKHIPQGAGLAGGSTDGAAVIDALSEMLGVLNEKETFDIAIALGSDVPFCLKRYKCGLCTGRGEIIKEIREPQNVKIEFVFPKTPLSTKGIYAEYDKTYGEDYSKSNSNILSELLEKGEPLENWKHLMVNDFQGLCEARCEEIKTARLFLEQNGFISQMSGSGSAVFGLKSK